MPDNPLQERMRGVINTLAYKPIPTSELVGLLQEALTEMEQLEDNCTAASAEVVKLSAMLRTARRNYDPHKGVGIRSVWPMTAPKE